MVREGRFADVLVRLVVHPKPDDVVVRLTFRPRLSLHRARRLLTELGIDSREALVH